jgi:hypothetical protein
MNRNNKTLERLERLRGLDPKHRGHLKDETIVLTWGDDDEQVNKAPAFCAGCKRDWKELTKAGFLPVCPTPVKPHKPGDSVTYTLTWDEFASMDEEEEDKNNILSDNSDEHKTSFFDNEEENE